MDEGQFIHEQKERGRSRIPVVDDREVRRSAVFHPVMQLFLLLT